METKRLLRYFLLVVLVVASGPGWAQQKALKHNQEIDTAFAAKLRFDSLFTWVRQNPPDGDSSNFFRRWQKTALLDKYGWRLTAQDWKGYRKTWTTDSISKTKYEKRFPILYYLDKTTDETLNEVASTKVTHGALMWKCYNMGYIIKTKDACFGIDINQPGSEKLASVLDFVIASHGHDDHYNTALLGAMVKAGKKVFSPFFKYGTLITQLSEFKFGETKVRFTLNMQADIPVIVTEVDCGAAANHYTIYHIGDGRLLNMLTPSRDVDLLILHIQNALNVFEAVKRIKPKVTVYDHVMELGHPVGKYRWSYDYTYRKISSQPHYNSWVLTWGERVELVN